MNASRNRRLFWIKTSLFRATLPRFPDRERAPARLIRTWLLLALLALTLAGQAARAQEVLQNIKFDPLSAQANGAATLTASPFDIGGIEAIFDGNVNSLARTPNVNPAFVQVAYAQPHTVRRFRVQCSYGDNYDWQVEKADTQADMDNHSGSYAVIVPTRNFPSGKWDEYALPAPTSAKIFRLNVRRYGGDGYCHINEWELYGDVTVNQLAVQPTSLALAVGQQRAFTARAHSAALNEDIDVTARVNWFTTGGVGSITSAGVFTATNAGAGSVYATLNALISPSAAVTVAAGNQEPDIDVLCIERTPRLAFDPNDFTYSSGLPSPGQAVTYQAHVKNWGNAPLTFVYQWRLDSAAAGGGTVTVGPRQTLTLPFAWNWQSADHTLEFIADPDGALYELSRQNNRLAIRTNGLLVGLWVEQSLYDHFHQNQYRLNDGANSFEDWGQRMIARWNELMARGVFPNAPNGALDRLVLDKVTIVPDGALPLNGGLPTNNPDSSDRTVDLEWGYPYHPEDLQDGAFYGFRWSGPFYLDGGSIHEMSHARFLTDLYAFDSNEPDAANPQRVLLRDDNNAPVAGSALMPFIAFDIVYYNKWRDLMGAGPFLYDAYNIGCWNWKAHRRGRGNMNAPPDFQVYMNDLPQNNHVQFVDQNGRGLTGAQVTVYQKTNGVFDNVADGNYTADADGYIHLPRNPFSALNAYGFGEMVFKVRYRGQLYFLFQELTDFNIEYWRGATQDAYYTREIDLRDNPSVVPQGQWLGNYFNGTNYQSFVSSRRDSAIDFAWGSGAPAPGVNANNYSVYWQGDVAFTEGWKTFTISADGGFQLYLNGRLVFDQGGNTGLHTWTPTIYTLGGSPFVNPGLSAPYGAYNRVEIRYRHQTGSARVHLDWADAAPFAAVPVNAWRADWYTTRSLSGYLTSRIETKIDADYGYGSPDPYIGGDEWSARWTGDWDFPAGTYTFTATVDDGVRVWIDNALIMDHWMDEPPTTYSVARTVSAGRHRIVVEYYEGGVTASAQFGWTLNATSAATVSGQVTPEGRANAAVPITFRFRPTNGSPGFTRVVTPASNGTFAIASIPRQNYTVAVKGDQWLQKVVGANATGGSVTLPPITLLGGDANNDNNVDNRDLALLASAYGSVSGDPNFDPAADFNGDGSVDNLDLSLLAGNYALSGDN